MSHLLSAPSYDVELIWIQPDGSVLNSDGDPVVRRPALSCRFGERG